jgi:hypothetical protein
LRKNGTISGTVAERSFQAENIGGTANVGPSQDVNPIVPPFHTLGVRNAERSPKSGTASGTVAERSPFADALVTFARACPLYVEPARWQQCIRDGRQFIDQWGPQAEALGWTPADLFGLHAPPPHPHPAYDPLARHDDAGLCWYLHGRSVTALSSNVAAIQTPGGNVLKYRRLP